MQLTKLLRHHATLGVSSSSLLSIVSHQRYGRACFDSPRILKTVSIVLAYVYLSYSPWPGHLDENMVPLSAP